VRIKWLAGDRAGKEEDLPPEEATEAVRKGLAIRTVPEAEPLGGPEPSRQGAFEPMIKVRIRQPITRWKGYSNLAPGQELWVPAGDAERLVRNQLAESLGENPVFRLPRPPPPNRIPGWSAS